MEIDGLAPSIVWGLLLASGFVPLVPSPAMVLLCDVLPSSARFPVLTRQNTH